MCILQTKVLLYICLRDSFYLIMGLSDFMDMDILTNKAVFIALLFIGPEAVTSIVFWGNKILNKDFFADKYII